MTETVAGLDAAVGLACGSWQLVQLNFPPLKHRLTYQAVQAP